MCHYFDMMYCRINALNGLFYGFKRGIMTLDFCAND